MTTTLELGIFGRRREQAEAAAVRTIATRLHAVLPLASWRVKSWLATTAVAAYQAGETDEAALEQRVLGSALEDWAEEHPMLVELLKTLGELLIPILLAWLKSLLGVPAVQASDEAVVMPLRADSVIEERHSLSVVEAERRVRLLIDRTFERLPRSRITWSGNTFTGSVLWLDLRGAYIVRQDRVTLEIDGAKAFERHFRAGLRDVLDRKGVE